ncbi:AAA family ATPase [Planctomicrobium sp. SH664]|uniref:AAA family ATPase n=1 Tax=Planctomicrobium sp. SH664 TaxID=3448125 RepID=UPI003F5B58A4
MRSKGQSIPQDVLAERQLIGCLLWGVDPEDVDPLYWFNEGRQIIVVTIQSLRQSHWTAPQSDHPAHLIAAARSNLERVAHAITATNLWPLAGDARTELLLCFEIATRPEDADFYLRRLIECHFRRQAMTVHERRLTAAARGELTTALEGTDLQVGGRGASASQSTCEPLILRLSDVQPELIQWLWPGRIPGGKLTLISGDPGLGKSLLTADLAARVSAGSCWPDGEDLREAGGIVILSAEDDPADTIRPRLDAAGADCSRISLLKGISQVDKKSGKSVQRPVSLQTDLDAIGAAVERTADCRMVIVDPINAYLGGVDNHKDTELRTVLTPLCELARKTGVAIVAVSHLNKSSGSPAIYRTMGSIGYVAAARVVWLVTKDPNDLSGRRRLMLPAKANLAPDTGGMAFGVKTSFGGQPILAWEEALISATADEILGQREDKRASKASPALTEAAEWLRGQLTAGPRPAQELIDGAKGDGIKEATLRRAKEKLNVLATREGFGEAGKWVWMLPGNDQSA